MRLTSLVFKVFGLIALYAFACGALQVPADGWRWEDFLARLVEPVHGLGPFSGAILVAGIFFLAAGETVMEGSQAGSGASGKSIPWRELLLAAFVVNALAVIAVPVAIFTGARAFVPPAETGALFAAGVLEAVIGVFLALILAFFARQRILFLPSLGLFIIGVGTLGMLFWIGVGALP